VTVGAVRATVIHNPGHTLGAISYSIGSSEGGTGAVFTGDTLFGAGCGRVFEGTPAMMHASLTRLAALPGNTRVYFGHEYTVANLRFAAAVEPTSHAIANRIATIEQARGRGVPSVPSTIGDERSTNPFLRTTEPAVIAAARDKGAASAEPTAVFAALREWKNGFR
jgi:hydroxyacylglutathione hydrolase